MSLLKFPKRKKTSFFATASNSYYFLLLLIPSSFHLISAEGNYFLMCTKHTSLFSHPSCPLCAVHILQLFKEDTSISNKQFQ